MQKILFLFLLMFSIHCIGDEPAKKKLLVLVIASDNHPAYIELQEIWKSYMNSAPDEITSYFIKGDPNLQASFEIRDNTLYTKTLDNYKPGILKKTILSMEALEPILDQYEFVLRTNLSSIYNFPKLLEYVNGLPKSRCYAARPLLPSYEVPAEYSHVPFGWGAGFILSCDMVRLLLAEKEKLYAKIDELPDDVLIGIVLHEKEVPIIATPFITLTKREEWHLIKNAMPRDVFHFRAKSHYFTRKLEDPYEDELLIASEIAKKFYPQISLKTNFQSSYPLEISLTTLYKFEEALANPNRPYLPDLKQLATSCSSSCEYSEHSLRSTWAILQGLSENGASNKSHVAIFRDTPSSTDLLLANKVAPENNIQFHYYKNQPLQKPVELAVISYQHETALESVAPSTEKYLALIDCPPDILNAFLSTHPAWQQKSNQNSLIILEKSGL